MQLQIDEWLRFNQRQPYITLWSIKLITFIFISIDLASKREGDGLLECSRGGRKLMNSLK
ncbi:hypothetical protein Scep_018638 [Stephania cephalantha]|uniref:Uncharacterized protein n=1 Tax=Stephania cephalantha TaxID=152367 RepID=A0AAP0I9F0_9MAGN